MAQRINVPEMTMYVEALIEADQKGISVIETLKHLAEQIPS